MSETYGSFHAGRSFTGHEIEDSCPCQQEKCGLVDTDYSPKECLEHPLYRSKTIRQGHYENQCPARDK